MTILSHHILNKAISVFFFGLLTMVYAEKFFHTHETNTVQECKGIHSTDNYVHCTICDFQVAKNAAIPEQAIAVQIILHYPVYQEDKPDSYYFIPSLSFAGRGPPAS